MQAGADEFIEAVLSRADYDRPDHVDWVACQTLRALGANIVVYPRALEFAIPEHLRTELLVRRLGLPVDPERLSAEVRWGLGIDAARAIALVDAVLAEVVHTLPADDFRALCRALPEAWSLRLLDATGCARARGGVVPAPSTDLETRTAG